MSIYRVNNKIDYQFLERYGDVDLSWQTTPPTKPGLYSCWIKGYDFTSWREFGECVAGGPGFFDFTHWLGPIPEPEAPQE